MLIPPPYPHPVSIASPHGALAVPDLPWVVGLPALAAPNLGSFKAMFTTIQRSGYGATLAAYLPHVHHSATLVNHDLNLLETAVMADINALAAAGAPRHTSPTLERIAVGIHLWGGRMGRGAFIRKGGFALNCPMHNYANLVSLIITHPAGVPLPGGNWPAIQTLTQTGFNQFGVSFMSKHLSFWSRAAVSQIILPILDSIIMKRFIKPNHQPNWVNYVSYVNQLNADCNIIRARHGLHLFNVSMMERQLFNFSPTPLVWKR